MGPFSWILFRRASSFLDHGLRTSCTTSSSGSDQTNFLTSWCISSHRRRMSNVLMVTTTVGVLHGVHGHTSNFGPSVSLHPIFMELTPSLQHGLINSTTTSDNPDEGSARALHQFLCSRRKTNSSGVSIWVVSNNCAIVS